MDLIINIFLPLLSPSFWPRCRPLTIIYWLKKRYFLSYCNILATTKQHDTKPQRTAIKANRCMYRSKRLEAPIWANGSTIWGNLRFGQMDVTDATQSAPHTISPLASSATANTTAHHDLEDTAIDTTNAASQHLANTTDLSNAEEASSVNRPSVAQVTAHTTASPTDNDTTHMIGPHFGDRGT